MREKSLNFVLSLLMCLTVSSCGQESQTSSDRQVRDSGAGSSADFPARNSADNQTAPGPGRPTRAGTGAVSEPPGKNPSGAVSSADDGSLSGAMPGSGPMPPPGAMPPSGAMPGPGAMPPSGAMPPPGGFPPPGSMLPPSSPNGPIPRIPGDGEGIVPAVGQDWLPPRTVASRPAGGHRPQIAVDSRGGLHVVYYKRIGDADAVVYRHAPGGGSFGAEQPVSQLDAQNWGPDLVIGPDDRPWVSYDHAQKDFTGQVFMVHQTSGGWSQPERISEATGVETSSSHLAFEPDGTLTVVWLSRNPQPGGRSDVLMRSRSPGGSWSGISTQYQGNQDALHSNIMRGAGMGIDVVGFDLMPRPGYRQVRIAVIRDGRIGPFRPVGDADLSTERPNFGFGADGTLFAAWTDSYQGARVGVSYVTGRLEGDEASWSEPGRITKGFRGGHYDPDIAGNSRGDVVLVWAWQDGEKASILYSRWEKGRFSAPRQIHPVIGMTSLPSIYAAPSGQFHLVWNHGSPDATEVMYTASRE